MKSFEMINGIKIVLISLLIVLAVWIILGMCLNNRVEAKELCKSCGETTDEVVEFFDNAQHSVRCPKCNNKYYEDHKYIHEENQTGAQDKCERCLYIKNSHIHTYGDKMAYNANEHYYECEYEGGCNYQEEKSPHDIRTKYNDNKHWVECIHPACGYTTESNGINHNITEVYESEGVSTHRKIKKCNGCSWKEILEEGIPHDDGSDHPGGVCKAEGCNETYSSHGKPEWGYYEKTDTTHELKYKCINSNCAYIYEGYDPEPHTNGNHADGKCGVCGKVYQNHSQSTTVKEYKQTDTGHIPVYKCTETGCESTYDGTEAAHTGGEHADGKCKVCKEVYQTHGKSATVKEYKKTETGHTPVYACTQTGCTSTYDGTEAAHTGGEHADGKCKVCKEVYQTHGKSATVKEYKKTETGHTPVYACTYSECTGTYDGTEVAHTGGKHGNDGKCEVDGCGYQYQNHSKSTTVKEYKKTETGHIPVYKCTETGCTSTYDGTETAHIVNQWADNENGTHTGRCTSCGYELTKEHNYENGECKECAAQQESETEECKHTYTTKSNNAQHWQECTKCEMVKTETLENHKYGTYTDDNNGKHSATCTVCNYKLTEEHNYEDGECKECNAEEPEPEEQLCEHTYTTKSNGSQHWKECTKCQIVKTGTLENHKYGTYTDDNNGKHSATCTVCKYKLTEEHNYEDEECKDCNAEKPKTEVEPCEHTYTAKSNGIQHWMECTKCETVKEGTLENHKYGTYTDNKDGNHSAICTECKYKLTKEHDYKDGNCINCNAKEKETETTPGNQNNATNGDTTTSDKEYTHAGITDIIVILALIIGILAIVTNLKMKKYKDI